MRILCLATEFPPTPVYGVGRYAFELCAALVAEGAEVRVASTNWEGDGECYERSGVQVSGAPIALPFRAYTDIADTLHDNAGLLARAIEMHGRDGDYDLVHIHNWKAASAGKALKETYRLPLVVTIHDTQIGKAREKLNPDEQYIAEMETWICEIADAVTVTSDFMRRELVEGYKVPAEKVTVIGCGVNPKSFQSNADATLFKTLFCEQGEQMVAFVGRIVPSNGPHVLLEALPQIVSLCPATKFVFAGEGQMREVLERRAGELNVADRVRFVGHLRGQVLATFYRAADILVVPSLYEPFGMQAMEAMVCETPVVVADTGGLSGIVEHEVSGLKVPPNDPRALASAIAQLLLKPDAARVLAAAGAVDAEQHYRWRDVANRTLAVYEKVLAACQKAAT